MKKAIVLTVVILTLYLASRGVKLYKKFRHAQRIKISVAKFKLLNLSSEIESNIRLQIGNFSESTFNIQQTKFEVFTPSGHLLAYQKAPLKNPLKLKPNQNNIIPIDFKINTGVALSELKRIGGISTVLANMITGGKNGLKLRLEGFVLAENIKKDINEIIHV